MKNRIINLILLLVVIISTNNKSFANSPLSSRELSESREKKIRDYFGDKINRLIYIQGQGRLDPKDSPFSLYVFTPETENPESPTYLIPLATSRSDQKTLPPVYIFNSKDLTPQTITLKKFLLEQIISNYSQDGKILLYRGAERNSEADSWLKGIPAAGARYWSTSPNYAWRYARRQSEFLDLLTQGSSPVLQFELPAEQFKKLAEDGKIAIGVELPQKVHQRLESGLGFTDHLANGYLYMGDPQLGVEIEIRSGRERGAFVKGYKGTLNFKDLFEARKEQIIKAYERAYKQWPQEKNRLEKEKNYRLTVDNLITEVSYNDFKTLSIIQRQNFLCSKVLLKGDL